MCPCAAKILSSTQISRLSRSNRMLSLMYCFGFAAFFTSSMIWKAHSLRSISAPVLREDQPEDGDAEESSNTGDEGAQRLQLECLIDLHVGELGNDPEVRIVCVRNDHGAGTDSQDDERLLWGCGPAKLLEHGEQDRRGGDERERR